MRSTPTRTRPLNHEDSLHLKAVQCWLALGNLEEANREMESIHPRNRRHPEVQRVGADLEAATRHVRMTINNDRILHPQWDYDAVQAETEYASRR